LFIGRFPTIRHNELKDFTATILSEVCHDVAIEPVLQRLTRENLHCAMANVEDEARLDVAATTVNKRLASLLLAKRDHSYGLVMYWL